MEYEICSFLCVIWTNRCPDYMEIYDRVCFYGGGEGECSNSKILYIILLIIIMIFHWINVNNMTVPIKIDSNLAAVVLLFVLLLGFANIL